MAGWLRARAGELAEQVAAKEGELEEERSELNVIRAAADAIGVRLPRRLRAGH